MASSRAVVLRWTLGRLRTGGPTDICKFRGDMPVIDRVARICRSSKAITAAADQTRRKRHYCATCVSRSRRTGRNGPRPSSVVTNRHAANPPRPFQFAVIRIRPKQRSSRSGTAHSDWARYPPWSGFPTPEQAALAGDNIDAETSVLASAVSTSNAALLVMSPRWHRPDLVLCHQDETGWLEGWSTSGSTIWSLTIICHPHGTTL
jgi:hypothetical protein